MSNLFAERWRSWKFPWKAAGAAFGALVMIAVLWWVPRYQVAHTPGVAGEKRFESEDEARKTLAQMLGGAVVLLGLYFSAKTFGLSREGQLTDRYTKAIEQLGKSDGGQPNIEVRLGAIYALERIAIDSPRDHWTIMEVLTAYVRRNARLEEPGLVREHDWKEMIRPEIQAIVTVLGRRRLDEGRERQGQVLELSRIRLWNADFSGGNFAGAHLSFADLRGADLSSGNFRGASLRYGDFRKTAFRNTNLYKASCFQADFRGAAFLRNDFRDADLMGCHFEGANLYEVNLTGAEIAGTRFERVTGLEGEQVEAAVGWADARYSPELRNELGLKEPVNEAAKGSS